MKKCKKTSQPVYSRGECKFIQELNTVLGYFEPTVSALDLEKFATSMLFDEERSWKQVFNDWNEIKNSLMGRTQRKVKSGGCCQC